MLIEGDPRDRNDEARRDLRLALRLAASIRTESGALPVSLLDLSRGGALAEGRGPLRLGAKVTLQLERLDVDARVAWVRGSHAGLAFDRSIRATELFFQLGRSRAAAKADGPPRPVLVPAIAA